MSLDKIIDQKGGKRCMEQRKTFQNSDIKNHNGSLLHPLVFSQVF